MIAPEHIWATKDGRWVKTGDVDAETLLYPKGHEVPDDEYKKQLKQKSADKPKTT